MFDLEKAIKNWRKALNKNEALEDGYKEELECHLRDKQVEQAVRVVPPYENASHVLMVQGEKRLKGDHLFVKINPDGNELWRSSFGEPKMIDYGMVLTETTNGGYVAGGKYERNLTSGIEDISLVKLDKNGQLLWQKIIETATHNTFAKILQLPDRGYVIAGSTIAKDDRFDIFLIETDHEGNVCR